MPALLSPIRTVAQPGNPVVAHSFATGNRVLWSTTAAASRAQSVPRPRPYQGVAPPPRRRRLAGPRAPPPGRARAGAVRRRPRGATGVEAPGAGAALGARRPGGPPHRRPPPAAPRAPPPHEAEGHAPRPRSRV